MQFFGVFFPPPPIVILYLGLEAMRRFYMRHCLNSNQVEGSEVSALTENTQV